MSAIQLAGTILNVAFARPLDFPGVAATIDEIVDVNVAIPTSHLDAESLFQAGNRSFNLRQVKDESATGQCRAYPEGNYQSRSSGLRTPRTPRLRTWV
jgi:hypothetical protein